MSDESIYHEDSKDVPDNGISDYDDDTPTPSEKIEHYEGVRGEKFGKATKEYLTETKEIGRLSFLMEQNTELSIFLREKFLTEEERAFVSTYLDIQKKGRQENLSDKEIMAKIKPHSEGIDIEKLKTLQDIIDHSDLLLKNKNVLSSYGEAEVAHMAVEDDEGGFIYQNTPEMKPKPEVTGRNSLMSAICSIGARVPRHLPLFSCGVRLNVVTPEDDRLFFALNEINEKKIDYGRETAGFYYSTDMVYTMTNIARLAFRYTFATNIEGVKELDTESRIEKLMELIPVTELNHIFHGLGYTLYPKGFPLDLVCTNEKCRAETTWNIDLGYAVHHLSSRIPDRLKRNMRKYKNNLSLENMEKYKEEFFSEIKSRKLTVALENDSEITFIFKIPSILEYEKIAEEWIESIIDTVDGFVGQEFVTEAKRNEIIHSKISMESLNRYLPYVKKIIISRADSDEPITIEDSDDNLVIRDALKDFSIYDDIIEEFTNGVVKFIADATPTVVGPPLPKCPKCGERHEDASPVDDKLMIFDPLLLFLVLGEWRLSEEKRILKKKDQNT